MLSEDDFCRSRLHFSSDEKIKFARNLNSFQRFFEAEEMVASIATQGSLTLARVCPE